jgi:hypothetical protein
MTQSEAVLALVAFTSLSALGLGALVLRWPAARLAAAGREALEIVGFGLAFFAVNVAIAVAATLVGRRLGVFTSLYLSNDIVLFLFSLLQGLVFFGWRRSTPGV